jgi:hypothetical protein
MSFASWKKILHFFFLLTIWDENSRNYLFLLWKVSSNYLLFSVSFCLNWFNRFSFSLSSWVNKVRWKIDEIIVLFFFMEKSWKTFDVFFRNKDNNTIVKFVLFEKRRRRSRDFLFSISQKNCLFDCWTKKPFNT